MRVGDVELQRTPEGDVLSGTVAGFRLFFRLRNAPANPVSADPFLAVALLAAMARREPLEVDERWAVSPRLVSSLDTLQQVFSSWLPELGRVPVRAREAAPAPASSAVGSFFSGGVDSLYTYLRREPEITHVVQIHGYDYRLENRTLADQAEAANRRFACARGRELIVVESNFRAFFEQHPAIHIYAYHGAVLAAVAMAVGLRRVYVPASSTWTQLGPWGSHPITDPLWGTEALELVHDGVEAGRAGKLAFIGREPSALDLLRVCPQNATYSCGVCEKCLRTRVCLRLLGLRSANFAPLESLGAVRRLRLRSSSDRQMWTENLAAAQAAGDHALARAIAFNVARYDARRAVVSLDRALLDGLVRRCVAGLSARFSREPQEPPVVRIDGDD